MWTGSTSRGQNVKHIWSFVFLMGGFLNIECGNCCRFNGVLANTNMLGGVVYLQSFMFDIILLFFWSPYWTKPQDDWIGVFPLHVTVSARNCLCVQHLANLDLECLPVFHKCSSFILKMTHVDASILWSS